MSYRIVEKEMEGGESWFCISFFYITKIVFFYDE